MKICIIRIDRMGDMILTLPIIKSIKLINPLIKIHIFSSNKNHKIVQNFKYIDKIFNIDENKNLKKENYDYIINFSPGWKSFFLCLFSKGLVKANLIFTSRYNNKFYSKSLIYIYSKIFFQETLLINRIKRFKEKKSIHQTRMMFKLLSKCKIKYDKNEFIEIFLPKHKNILSSKKICLIHLSSKWINNYYNEENLIDLIINLENKFNLILTTDQTTINKFNTIFNKFPIINNKEFKNYSILKKTTIFKNFEFENWVQAIYVSNYIITPECGCSHIAAICKIPSKIIYDPNNKPDMIYAEYAPWKSKHQKYIFGEKNLNDLLIENL